MAISRLSDIIRQRRIRLACHCVRHPELMASEMILWEPTHGKKSRGSATVMAHASQPYSRMDSIHATKNLFLRPDFMFDFHTRSIPFRAYQARAFLTAISFSVLSTHDPRYLKSSLHSRTVPSEVCRGVSSSILYFRYFVLGPLRPRPTKAHSFSTRSSSS